MVDVSSVEALDHVVQPHLQLASERAANLELLHLLSYSPDSYSGGSSSEADAEDSDSFLDEEGPSSRKSQYPMDHLAAIREYPLKKVQRSSAAPPPPTKTPSKQKLQKASRIVFSQLESGR